MMTVTSPVRVWVVFAALMAASSMALGQQPSTTASNALPPGTAVNSTDDGHQLPVFRMNSDEVNVIFTVTDKHNHFIKNLRQDQFEVLDNNMPPRQILNFEAETNMPLRVGLLIDASNSIRDRFRFEQQAAAQFLRQIVRPESDKAFVLAFDDVDKLTQDFTGDLDKLTHGINAIHPGGGTAVWDAVYYACKAKLLHEHTADNKTLRKALVVVSDGADNQSRVSRRKAIDMAQHAGVIIYTISTNLSNIHDRGDYNLKVLAEATGGRAFYPYKLHDLTNAFRSIGEELRSQYAISYKPQQVDTDGQYRPIKITAENKKYHVRSKKGYYVQKEAQPGASN
jgi:Ca-activated chloride channel family protein